MARFVKPPMHLPIDALVAFDGEPLTDHNRRPISIGYDPIRNEKRMVNGTLRRYVVAEKRNWKVSWEDIPSKSLYVVDGYWAGEELRSFYEDTPGEFTFTINYGDGTSEDVLVMISSFNYNVTKRTTDFDFWDMDIALVEV